MKPITKSLFFLLILFITSCAREYIPTTVNSPLLSNKNEFQVNMLLGTSGYDQQLAYALTDNIGFIATTSFSAQTNNIYDDDYHRHFLVDVGIGGFSKIGKIGRFELYGGYGYGDIKSRLATNYTYQEVNLVYNKIFIQPGIGTSTKIIDLSFSPRFSMIMTRQNEFFPMLEPVFNSKIGFKHVFLSSQIGFSVPITMQNYFNYFPLIAGFGMEFKFGRIYD